MNLAGAQGISYAIRGDATQLRQALREAASDTRAFGQTIQSALVGPAQAAAAAQAQITTAAASTAAALRAQASAAVQAGSTTAAASFSAGAALGRQAAAATTAAAATAGAANTTAAAQARAAASANAAANSQAAASARAAAAAESAAAAQAAAAATVAAANARVAGSAAGAAGAMNTMGATGVASLSSMSSILSHLVGPLGFAALIAMIAKTGVGFNDFLARQEIAFTTMLGSASGAKEFLSDMLAFAKTTPFSFPELTASAQKMVAFGIESDKVVDIMRTLGDATVGSGGSMAELQGLGIVLGQVSAKGRLMGQELLQFAERGIPALTVLANKSNMSVADFQEKVSKGQVRSEEAITNLIDGLRDGTSGINGTTAAYDGLMAKVKESNIFSSAFDSFKSGFRTMSAELTESLTPALVGLVNIGGDAMGAVKGVAAAFNGMAGPAQAVAIAIAAVAVSGLLLGRTLSTNVGAAVTRMSAVWASQLALARSTNAVFASSSVAANRMATGMQAAFGTAVAGARSAARGISAAFGGPWGLGITAAIALVTSLFAMNAQASAQAKADAQALADTLDQTTGAITEGTEAWIQDALVKERARGNWINVGSGSASMIADAEKMGIALTDLTTDALSTADGIAKVRAAAEAYRDSDSSAAGSLRDSFLTTEDGYMVTKFLSDLDKIEDGFRSGEAAAKNRQKLNEVEIETFTQMADRYRDAAYSLHGFTEEQDKAIASAADAAGKAFDTAFATINSFKAVIVTEKELADARQKVTDATSSLRDAEDTQGRNAGRRKTTSADRKKSADDVAKAIRNQSDAQKELTELEAKDIPIGDQMMEHYRKTLEDAQKFAGDIEALSSAGLDPALINDLTILGPEQAAPQLQELLGANGAALIAMANQTEDELNGLNMRVVENARLTAIAMQSDLASTAADLPTAMKIAAAQNGRGSVSAANLSTLLGIPEGEVERIAASFGQDWVKGRDEYLEQNPMKTGSMTIPGQAPKVDVAPEPVLIDGWDTSLTNGMTQWIQSQILTPEITVKPTFSFIGDALAFGAGAVGGAQARVQRSHGGNFYNGGIYPGYTPGRDTGYIGVGGGEAIMRPEWTRAMGPDYVHTMNALARGGGVNAVRKAMAGTGYMGAFAGGGIAGGSQWAPSSAPQIIEVPVTQRIENHGVTNIGQVNTPSAADFERQMRQRNRRGFTGGRG